MRLPDVAVPRVRPVPALLLLGAAAFLLVAFNDTYRFALTSSLIIALLALSYVVITGYLGQISLAQSAFVNAAGFALAKLTAAWNMPFPLAIVLCALVAACLGMAVSLLVPDPRRPARHRDDRGGARDRAVRVRQLQPDAPDREPDRRPGAVRHELRRAGGRDLARVEFSLMVLVVVALVIWMFIRIARGDTGRAFLAVRANERAAASAGIDVRRTKLMGFGLSAFIAVW